jgi:tRNA pseudouridine38-40 synthase
MTQSRNLRLLIAYDGTDFHGWQRQPSVLTVQECLESVIQKILGEKAQLYGSGRTDAGVHALNQVANFKTACSIPCENLMKALNDSLPPTVRIKDVQEVAAQFHARYSVRSKTYRYRILQAPVASPFLCRFVWHYPFKLNVERMAAAATLFEGEHDFTSFAAAEGGSGDESLPNGYAAPALLPVPLTEAGLPGPLGKTEATFVRRIFRSRILRRTGISMLTYEVTGNGFLHHMVRNMVGTLIEVGRGKLEPDDITRIVKGRDRSMAGPTAPAQGLCLVRVEY